MSHSHQKLIGLCLLVLALGTAPAQEKRPAAAEVTAVFQDGSVLKGIVLSGSVELTTRYGKLTVPLEEVKRIEFGFHVSAAEARNAEQAVARLRSEKEEERGEARRQLVALGRKAVAALEKATRDKEDTFACRARAVLDAIQKAVPAEQLRARGHDIVVTGEGVFTGSLAGESLKARTKTLGEITFKITDLRSLHGPGDAPDQPSPGSSGVVVGAASGPTTPADPPPPPIRVVGPGR